MFNNEFVTNSFILDLYNIRTTKADSRAISRSLNQR